MWHSSPDMRHYFGLAFAPAIVPLFVQMIAGHPLLTVFLVFCSYTGSFLFFLPAILILRRSGRFTLIRVWLCGTFTGTIGFPVTTAIYFALFVGPNWTQGHLFGRPDGDEILFIMGIGAILGFATSVVYGVIANVKFKAHAT